MPSGDHDFDALERAISKTLRPHRDFVAFIKTFDADVQSQYRLARLHLQTAKEHLQLARLGTVRQLAAQQLGGRRRYP